MKKILFTGFEPFGGEKVNPSWEAVALLPERMGEAMLVKRRMPVEYDRVAIALRKAIEEEKPDAVICTGQAAGRASLTPEMVAINWKDSPLPDNAGKICSGEVICPLGPAAYFATIPVRAVCDAMLETGIPATVSYTAGTYVCNSIMYQLLWILEREYPAVKGGFIHVPCVCSQALGKPQLPSLPLSVIAAGLETAARVTAMALEEGIPQIERKNANTL